MVQGDLDLSLDSNDLSIQIFNGLIVLFDQFFPCQVFDDMLVIVGLLLFL